MSKRTATLIAFLTVLTAFFIYLAVSQNAPKKQMAPKATPTAKPSMAFTTMQLRPEKLALSSSRSGSVDVVIDTHGEKNKVTAVQLEFSYDPTKLTNVKVTPGTFIGSTVPLLDKVDTKTGRITYALAIPPSGSGKSGSGTVATISFQAVAGAGETMITVLPQTLITAEGIVESVLKNATGVTISTSSSTAPSRVAPSTPATR